MIFAELQGKLGQNHSRAHERAEDVLTSTVFGLLRYLPLAEWLMPLARRIRPIQVDRGPSFPPDGNWLEVSRVARCNVVLWQRRSPYGEPDVLLWLRDAQGALVHLVVIEVKLYSPKSGSASYVSVDADDEDSEEELAGIDRDQLARYWRFACEEVVRAHAADPAKKPNAPPPAVSLVYLTAHPTAPSKDLLISLAAGGSAMRLGWLSWFDVWQVVHDAAQASGSLPAADLKALLEHKGFRRFMGFRRPTSQPSAESARFWRRRPWFCSPPFRPCDSARFWNITGTPRP